MKKNRARNKSSWLCFQIDCKKQPVNLDSKSPSNDLVKKSVVKHEENLPIATISIENKMSGSTSEKGISRSGSSSSRRKLSKIVKTVFFETILIKSKRIKEETYKDFSDLKSNRPTLKEKEEDGLHSRNCSNKVLSTSSSSSSLSSSILTSCSSSSNLYSLSERKKSSSFRSNSLESKQILVVEESKQSKSNNKKIRSLSSTNGLYLLLISLIVLIFWGRICAIISTSTWVYFGPLSHNNYDKEDEEEIVVKPVEQERMESREYKKRVIMEGLLERNHSRF